MDEAGSEGRGLFASLRRLAQTALGALQNRVELFAVELAEEKSWLVAVLLWSAAAIFFGVLAITVITLTIVVLCPAEARPYVLIGLSVVYLALAVFAGLRLQRQIKNRPPPFSGSLSEMKKDLESLRSEE